MTPDDPATRAMLSDATAKEYTASERRKNEQARLKFPTIQAYRLEGYDSEMIEDMSGKYVLTSEHRLELIDQLAAAEERGWIKGMEIAAKAPILASRPYANKRERAAWEQGIFDQRQAIRAAIRERAGENK